jgi:hypothetical protein
MARVLRQVALGHVVLALARGEVHQGDPLRLDEGVDGGHEVLGHGVHEGRGNEGPAPVVLEEPNDARLVHQLGLVDVEVHPVDALDLQAHVVSEDIGGTSRYGHRRLRSTLLL